jgi:hypothetical protein
MTLDLACKQLNVHLQALREELVGLRTTIREDRPLGGDTVLVDVFGDASDDMLGWLAEALGAARDGGQALENQLDLNRAWQALTTCQEQFSQLEYRLFDLVSYDRLAPLMRFGRQQGGEWRAWTRSVKAALDRCQSALYHVNQALVRCWQEIAERAGLTSVSVRTTNIGQQITVPQGWETAQEEVP